MASTTISAPAVIATAPAAAVHQPRLVKQPRLTDRRVSIRPATALASLFVLALAVRLFEIRRSYNIFVDEITYSTIGRNLATGHGLTLYGAPFNLHPPAVFAIIAGIIRVFALSDATPDQLVLDLRPVAAVFGSATVVVVFLVARKCGASFRGALCAAAIVMLDPFELSFDSRTMLEAISQFFTISGVALVAALAAGRESLTTRSRRLLIAGAGAATGLSFCSKETFGLVLALTLIFLIVSSRATDRRSVSAVLAVGSSIYAAVTVAVIATSGFGPWWRAHASGLSRLVGSHQTTGFNASSTKVSLVSRLTANVGNFAPTYSLLIVGAWVVATTVLVSRPWRQRERTPLAQARLVLAMWALAAGCYLVYATLFGSIEAQMYYIALAPCVVNVLVAVTLERRHRRRQWRHASGVIFAVLMLFDLLTLHRIRAVDNNSYEQFVTWSRSHIATGSRIGVTEDVGQFLLRGVTIGKWQTLDELRAHHADYVLAETSLVDQGYSKLTPDALAYLERNAVVAFAAHSQTDGTLYLFDVRTLLSTSGGPGK